MFDDQELVADFVVESLEGMAEIESDLLSIEAEGASGDSELVNKVFRTVHTIKGTSGFLSLNVVGKLAHALENVLCLMRNDELVADSATTDALLKAADTLKMMIEDVGNSESVDVSEHVRLLTAIAEGKAPSVDTESNDADSSAAADVSAEPVAEETDQGEPAGNETSSPFDITETQFAEYTSEDTFLYALTFDLIDESKQFTVKPSELLRRIRDVGQVFDGYVESEEVGDLDSPSPQRLLFRVLVSSILESHDMLRFWGLPEDCFVHITSAGSAESVSVSTKPTVQKAGEKMKSEQSLPQAPSNNGQGNRTAEKAAASASTSKSSSPQSSGQAPTVEANIRVPVSVLDQLMNLAGELVLGRNQLLQTISQRDTRGLESVGARLDQVTSELQETIMMTRMQQIGNVFTRFTRVVRDLSQSLEKQCNLIIEGKDVDLDKTIIEAIGDPLTHLIRNSVDHGIETPAVRAEQGKNPTGTITLQAYHQEGKVNICIEDDGGGIDAERLKEKAVSKGLITREEADSYSDREAVRLIFHPGFSMAEQVTDVSGRGVGMDVVRTNLERIGGSIEIDTQLGVGTKINIKLPLTLAIIPSLIVRSGDDRFAIPQVNISELVRIKGGDVASHIQEVQGAEVLRLRGTLLPLVRLNAALGIESTFVESVSGETAPNHRENIADRRGPNVDSADVESDSRSENDRRTNPATSALNVIVVEAGQLRYGVIVDGLNDSEEIVVKPLGRHMAECNCLSGATVLGDGRVALILDIGGIASHTELRVPETDESHADAESAGKAGEEKLPILLFTNDPGEQFGIPMSSVARIERIKTSQIDSIGGKAILQYRGVSLPLINMEDHLTVSSRPEQPRLYVVVYDISGQEVGLIAPQLVDIRNISTDIDTTTFVERGILGSTIIDETTTRLLDMFELTRVAHPEWFKQEQAVAGNNGDRPRILLAEDSEFFREQVKLFVEYEGYDVVAVEDGLAAWNRLHENHEQFDLVLTDIEMPNLNGFELCKRIKADSELKHLPVIAVTSLGKEEDIERGRKCGIDDYQVKLNREALAESIAKYIPSSESANGSADRRTLETIGSSS
jgi:two-component system, chemotaxis family, sensor kinase CheA